MSKEAEKAFEEWYRPLSRTLCQMPMPPLARRVWYASRAQAFRDAAESLQEKAALIVQRADKWRNDPEATVMYKCLMEFASGLAREAESLQAMARELEP